MKLSCPHCGGYIKPLNPHHMDRQKVLMLQYLNKINDWVEVKAGRIPQFTGDEQVHCMRLGWFQLAEYGPRRSSLYRITDAGRKFLQGEYKVPHTIWCRDGDVVARSSALVGIESVKGVILDKAYWDNYHGTLQVEGL